MIIGTERFIRHSRALKAQGVHAAGNNEVQGRAPTNLSLEIPAVALSREQSLRRLVPGTLSPPRELTNIVPWNAVYFAQSTRMLQLI